MNDNTVILQPAFILHSRQYRETSLLLDVFTRDYGKVAMLAKGVRKIKSKTVGLLQPFNGLNISFTGQRDLKTLTNVELNAPVVALQGMSLYCGFYLNELIQHFLHGFDPHPEIYTDYKESLSLLNETNQIESILRLFELNLLEHTGYGLQFYEDCLNGKPIELSKQYQYYAGQGLAETSTGPYSGATLIALRDKQLHKDQVLREAKKLLRTVIDTHLAHKALKSRALFSQYKKYMSTGVDV